jgi:hypothetical protein
LDHEYVGFNFLEVKIADFSKSTKQHLVAPSNFFFGMQNGRKMMRVLRSAQNVRLHQQVEK